MHHVACATTTYVPPPRQFAIRTCRLQGPSPWLTRHSSLISHHFLIASRQILEFRLTCSQQRRKLFLIASFSACLDHVRALSRRRHRKYQNDPQMFRLHQCLYLCLSAFISGAFDVLQPHQDHLDVSPAVASTQTLCDNEPFRQRASLTDKQWTGNEVRKTFLKFFEERGHRVVRSSSLVPTNDPTLLFINAGMNQFKDVFLGLEKRDYNRATTCQKCVRAGGKHNDLENVGFTNRHHTFFEMLGNFSFGDYFKKDAIAFAMELITSPDWYGIPLEKLYFTVFGGAEVAPGNTLGTDTEAADFWLGAGAAKDRVFAIPGLKDNFWAMGDTGPCGPCSEIFYDMGRAAVDDPRTPECASGKCTFPCDCGRYVEIWNLVFMQFNRDASGNLNPLPKPSVDTGMGLERTTAVLEHVISNYDTDLFVPLTRRAAELCGVDLKKEESLEEGRGGAASLRVVADHARATTFLLNDGVVPSNEGRGYVLRKIIRRAIHHGRLLGQEQPFLYQMVSAVRDEMKDAYPELIESAERVSGVVKAEETRFTRTLDAGLGPLEDDIYNFALQSVRPGPGDKLERNKTLREAERADLFRKISEASQAGRRLTYPGKNAFKFYDTFGLPLDFIQDAVRDFGLDFEQEGFERAMDEQRTRARASWKGSHKDAANPVYSKLAQTNKTEQDFYFGTKTRDARIEAIITKDGTVNEIKAGTEAEVVLDRTSIYSESGGQVADTGGFFDNSGALEVAEVRGAYYPVTGLIAHRIVAKEDLHVGDHVATIADPERRVRDMRNHTATHLLNAALRNILGTHVKQAGSLVAPDYLRFDFSHFAQVDPSELGEIEQQVNEEIRKNLEMRTDIMNIDDALSSGALAFFGDKYPEANVRVVTIPDANAPRGFYSKELCGGTHVIRTGDIGVFKIIGEQSVAAGVRRIEAISGDRALAEYQKSLATLRTVAGMLNSGEDEIVAALERQFEATKQLEKQLEVLKRKAAGSLAGDLIEQARTVKNVRLIAAQVNGFDREALRQLVDALRQKLGSGVVVLASADDGKVALITAVTKDLIPKLHAGKIVQELAKLVGGSGGGRPDLAEAGGKDTSGIQNALDQVYPLLDRLL
jgi:alanyl-tRNA synthetase